MKIEAGKYYKTRDGRKVGPIKDYEDKIYYKASFSDGKWTYLENGKWAGDTKADNRDLIAEWQDEAPSPIRTVTRREIVPGVYGRIKITGTYQGNRVTMDWDRSDIITAAVPIVGMSAEELREAAHLLNQIAEVLEENGE